MSEFYAFVKEVLTALIPLALAYIAWRQHESEMLVKEVNKDVKEVKAVGNSMLREAMVTAVHATETTAVVTDTESARIAAEVAKQRLAEHDVSQAKGNEAAAKTNT